MKQTRLINQVVGGSYEADERIAGCAVSQNLYAESVESAQNGYYFTSSLRSVPGERVVLEDFVDSDENRQGCRGLFVASDNSVFAAYGDGIYRITYNSITREYHSELVHAMNPHSLGRVRFCETGGINSHVCWIDGKYAKVYAYPLSDLDRLPDMDFPIAFTTPLRQYKTADEVMTNTEQHVVPDQICSLNGSLVINDPETDTWYYTDPYILGGVTYTREVYDLDAEGNVQYKDGSAYEVKTKTVNLADTEPASTTSYLWLDRYSKPHFTTAEYLADRIEAMAVCGDYLFVLGTGSLQVYNQAVSTDAQGFSSMVFSSAGRNIRDLGCSVKDSVVVINGNLVFLGSSARGERSIWYTAGGTPVRISTNAIERMLEGEDLSTAYAIGYMENGHVFYVLTVPSIDKTFCYDFATSQWHNRSTYRQNCTSGLWWPAFCASVNGHTLLGGVGVEALVRLDKEKYDDYKGDPIVKVRTAPVITSDYSPFVVNDLMLLWNNGTTKDYSNEDGAKNPVVMLEVSRDGGNTFDDERWAYGGRAGQYGYRTVWYGLGAGTMFVFRFTISDRVNVVITGAKISHTVLAHF